MKNAHLFKRVESLDEKLCKKSGNMVHIDFDSFSEEEKHLFRKVDEIEEKYLQTGNMEPYAENLELIYKNLEVILRRVREMYCYVVPMVLGCNGTKEIVEHFFKLHFYNFEADLTECLMHVNTWTEKDRREFLSELQKNGSFLLFRIPRGFNDHGQKIERSKPKNGGEVNQG